MKYLKLFEEHINEIGDASAKKFRYKGPSPRQILQILDKAYNSRENQSWSDQKSMNWEFSTENADYIVNIYYSVNAYLTINLGRRKPGTTPRRRQLNGGLGFSVKADKREDRERVTNFGEHFRVLATVCDIFVDFINTVADDYILNNVYMIPKAENDETEDTDNQRGRFYEPYIKKQIKRIKRKVTVQNTTIKTNDGKMVGGFVLKDGHIYTMGGKRHKEFRNESRVYEIGDRSVPAGDWIQSKYEKDHKGYSFMTKDQERYYAYFEKKPRKWLEQQGMMKILKGSERVWETSFGHLKGHIHGYGGTVDFKTATNKGSHFEILSTYAEIMEDFLKNNKGKADIIIAKPEKGSEGDSRRLRLYQAFLAKTKLFKNVTTESIFGQDVILLYL